MRIAATALLRLPFDAFDTSLLIGRIRAHARALRSISGHVSNVSKPKDSGIFRRLILRIVEVDPRLQLQSLIAALPHLIAFPKVAMPFERTAETLLRADALVIGLGPRLPAAPEIAAGAP